MNNKTRSTLKLLAVVIVLVMVLMELQIFIVPMLVSYKFWLMVVAFGLALIASR